MTKTVQISCSGPGGRVIYSMHGEPTPGRHYYMAVSRLLSFPPQTLFKPQRHRDLPPRKSPKIRPKISKSAKNLYKKIMKKIPKGGAREAHAPFRCIFLFLYKFLAFLLIFGLIFGDFPGGQSLCRCGLKRVCGGKFCCF